MKKITAIIMALIIFVLGGNTAEAKEIDNFTELKGDFEINQLLVFLSVNNVETKAEFLDAIEKYGNEDAKKAVKDLRVESVENSEYNQEVFTYYIDYDRQVIVSNTLHYSIDKSNENIQSKSQTYEITASTQYEEYSTAGIHLFTVSVEGRYSYANNSFCNVLSSQGYFNPAFLGLYSSSPWISSGNYSTKEAYVNVYGTANWDLGIAQLIGINANIHSVNYSLVLKCDSNGKVTADYYVQQIN